MSESEKWLSICEENKVKPIAPLQQRIATLSEPNRSYWNQLLSDPKTRKWLVKSISSCTQCGGPVEKTKSSIVCQRKLKDPEEKPVRLRLAPCGWRLDL